MKIAVVSGKGGTGKTTVAVALARVLGECVFVDCDVEAPNAHLFMDPKIEDEQDVFVMVPKIDESKCSGCAECSRVCQFHALAVLGKNVILFPELCHGCGGCELVCEPGAITEGQRLVGRMRWGRAGEAAFYDARLRIGEPMSPPLIRALKKKAAGSNGVTILDCPPGTTCPMLESVKGVDYCLLVTEPTPFGLHDLAMAWAAVTALGVPSGVIINRADMGDDCVHRFCREKGISILLEIPHRREIAEGYAAGRGILLTMPELGPMLEKVLEVIAGRLAA